MNRGKKKWHVFEYPYELLNTVFEVVYGKCRLFLALYGRNWHYKSFGIFQESSAMAVCEFYEAKRNRRMGMSAKDLDSRGNVGWFEERMIVHVRDAKMQVKTEESCGDD